MDPLTYWRPAIENVRSRGIRLTPRQIEPLLTANDYLMLTEVNISPDYYLHDNSGEPVLLPVIVHGCDPIEGHEMLDWSWDGYPLQHAVPAVYGTVHEEGVLDPFLGWWGFDGVHAFPYWDCLALNSQRQYDAAQNLCAKMRTALESAGYEVYQYLQHTLESGEVDPSWAHHVLTVGLEDEVDREIMKQFRSYGDDEMLEEAAQVWSDYLAIESKGGIESLIPPLEEVADQEQLTMIVRLLQTKRTHTQQYMSSLPRGPEHQRHRYMIERYIA